MSLILACGVAMKMGIKMVFGHTDVQLFIHHVSLEKGNLDYPFIFLQKIHFNGIPQWY